jgi:hypothetical protein
MIKGSGTSSRVAYDGSVNLRAGLCFTASLALCSSAFATTVDKQTCVQAYESAQRLRREGKLRASREQLLVCAQNRCPELARQDCVKWLREVEDAMPTVIVQARDTHGSDLADVRVTFDGKPLLERLDGQPVDVDPGEHTMRFEFHAEPPVDQTVIIASGEKNRMLSVSFKGPQVVRVSQIQTQPPPGSAPPPKEADRPRATIPATTVVLGSIGVALVGLSAYFEVKGIGDRQTLFDTCAGRCTQSQVDFAYRELRAGDILGAVGLAAIGTALWVALARQPSSPSAGIDLRPTRGGGLIGAAARF